MPSSHAAPHIRHTQRLTVWCKHAFLCIYVYARSGYGAAAASATAGVAGAVVVVFVVFFS